MVDEPSILSGLSDLLAQIQAESVPVAQEQFAQAELDRFELSASESLAKEKVRAAKLFGDSLEQDIGERKKYATSIFWMVCLWLLLVLLIVVSSGWDLYRVHISDAVLIALITGVSVNVIALFAIVAKYLFPKR